MKEGAGYKRKNYHFPLFEYLEYSCFFAYIRKSTEKHKKTEFYI